jgi:hypothetical protein
VLVLVSAAIVSAVVAVVVLRADRPRAAPSFLVSHGTIIGGRDIYSLSGRRVIQLEAHLAK